MQGSEEKKKTGRHAAPEPELAPQSDVIRADTDLYGDEAEAPVRKRKEKKPSSPKKEKTKKQKSANKPKTGRKKIRLYSKHSVNEKSQTGAVNTVIEVVTLDKNSYALHSILILGRRLPLWPIILLGILFVFLAFVLMNNSNLEIDDQSVTVVGLPVDLEDYKMLVISDLNGHRFGDKQSSLLRTIGNLDYDSIFFLGDMVGSGGDPQPFYEILEGIPASKEVFFICGDTDPGPFVETPRDITGTLSQMVLEDWILGAIERGATYVDAPVSLNVGASKIWISPSTLLNLEANEFLKTWNDQMEQEEDGVLSGLKADYNTLPITSYRQRAAQRFYDATPSMTEEDFCIVLSHEVPSKNSLYAAASHGNDSGRFLEQAELVLAGHYCGGVWRLPLIGAFYVPDNMLPRNGWFPAQDRTAGLSSVGETQVYITSGLDINTKTPVLSFRLFNQPQLSLITLTATLPENMLSAE